METVLFAFLALFGAIWGSFGTVLAYRIPREIPLGLKSHRRSQCPKCEKQIAWYDNVPILAFLWLKGQCRQCKEAIELKYFLIEVGTAILFPLAIWVLSLKAPILFWGWSEISFAVLQVTFLYFLWITTFIDIEFRIIPDRFSLGGLVIALAASFLFPFPGALSAWIGAVFGVGVFYGMAWAYERWKGFEGLGMGDVKMIGWLGAWLGFENLPFIILVASLSGLLVGLIAMWKSKQGMQTAIPFGPFLALGAFGAWLLQFFIL